MIDAEQTLSADRGYVDKRLSVDRVGGIEVDETADAVARPVGSAGDDHAAVTVTDENDVALCGGEANKARPMSFRGPVRRTSNRTKTEEESWAGSLSPSSS